MRTLLSIYRHPTLTVLIDDSRSFLDSLEFQLNPQSACKAFVDAPAAIDWLRGVYQHCAKSIHHSIQVDYDVKFDSLERRSASIDVGRIYQEVLNRQRFDTPAVIVVDYAMPKMNGIELCQAIGNLPCKKILLTGRANEKIAVDAFNRKLIDRYIKKNDPDALGDLGEEIIALQKDFFVAKTHTLADLLSRHSYAFLSDPAIGTLTEQLCNHYRFVEYYLFPNPFGILFFDAQGKATLMVIETKAGLVAQVEVAQDHNAPPELLTALRECRVVPFFSDTGGMYLDEIENEWLSYCLPAQLCRGQENYYWALFDLPPGYLQGRVYSYADFLRDRGAASPGPFRDR